MKAIWAGAVIAESQSTLVIEGNHYFPPDSVNQAFLRTSNTHTVCSWKGVASYCDVVAGDRCAKDAAWYYPEPLDAARNIAGWFAFWRGVETVE